MKEIANEILHCDLEILCKSVTNRMGLYVCHIFWDDFMRNSNFGIGVLYVRHQILKIFYGSVFVIGLHLQKAMYRSCDLDL